MKQFAHDEKNEKKRKRLSLSLPERVFYLLEVAAEKRFCSKTVIVLDALIAYFEAEGLLTDEVRKEEETT